MAALKKEAEDLEYVQGLIAPEARKLRNILRARKDFSCFSDLSDYLKTLPTNTTKLEYAENYMYRKTIINQSMKRIAEELLVAQQALSSSESLKNKLNELREKFDPIPNDSERDLKLFEGQKVAIVVLVYSHVPRARRTITRLIRYCALY